MISIQPEQSVGDLVRQHPSLAAAFERLGIDYCCGGKTSLADACAKRGLDARTTSQILGALGAGPRDTVVDADRMSLHELISHIQSTHHAYLRQQLPVLRQMLDRVVAAHADGHAELRELARVFAGFEEELMAHMHKEDFVLFPMIDRLETTGECPMSHCGSLRNPIGVMEHEHESAGAALARMRELTSGYTAPPGACATWRALVHGLAELEADMHQHVHKENNVLFPKAAAMESALTQPAAK